jgi:uncharacterized caspase-like protein
LLETATITAAITIIPNNIKINSISNNIYKIEKNDTFAWTNALAAKGNQTSQSLEEVKHGLFSYYTMLGMEGGADANNDNKITASELHAFIKDKVERQSQFRQTPELQGDADRVLVQFN